LRRMDFVDAAGVAEVPRKRRCGEAGLHALVRARVVVGAPAAGKHNFFRGGDLGVYAGETEAALAALGTGVDQAACRTIWEEALSSRWEQAPVWVHGDVSAGNVLIRDGRLTAIIDFGSSAIGDPACDLYIAWTFLDAARRAAFRISVGLDKASWARGRGWTLWKALIVLAGRKDGANDGWALRVIEEIIADYQLEHADAKRLF
jgi:aminoglycoside phosphotransferase (APT) family kinase protein